LGAEPAARTEVAEAAAKAALGKRDSGDRQHDAAGEECEASNRTAHVLEHSEFLIRYPQNSGPPRPRLRRDRSKGNLKESEMRLFAFVCGALCLMTGVAAAQVPTL